MYNIELYNRTKRSIIISRQVRTLKEAAQTALEFIARAKGMGEFLGESIYDISSYGGYVVGQTIYSTRGELCISTARM